MNIWLTKCTNNLLYEHIFCTFSFWWLFKHSSVFVCYYIFTVVSHKSDLTDPPPPLPKLLIYATAVLLSIITLICLMSLLSLKKLGGPSLAPKNSRALICNACSCLVYIPPVSIFFTLPPPQASKLGSVYIVVSTDTFFKLLVAVIILFWHQGSSFLEKSKTVILAGKTFVLL